MFDQLSHGVIVVKPHNLELDESRDVMQNGPMAGAVEYPFVDQGRRLRFLRQAERFDSGDAFAKFLGWNQSGISQFETGRRQVPADKALQLARKVPGFDPLWLWTGDKKGLSYDLRKRIEKEEAKESGGNGRSLARGER